MSLRDDLETLIQAAAWTPPPSHDEILAACSRLRAALTPAAIKWLEALPELMELRYHGAKPTIGPWSVDVRAKITHIDGFLVGQAENWPDARLIVKLCNALHEAARLYADSSALNAQDNKEQK